MVQAWYMDEDTESDQRLEHKNTPNEPVSLDQLCSLGVVYWHLESPDSHETDPKLQTIRDERGYNYQDIITVSPTTLPNYEEKIKTFFEEHIHDDEEIRYCLDGTGYFDIRDLSDRWIRIAVEKGDMIVLPEGIYHRFTLDTRDYIKAMRLFQGEPVWTPFNRPQEEHPSRAKYVDQFGAGGGPKRAKTECTIEAWYMDPNPAEGSDQRDEHRQVPNRPCPPAELDALGVLRWHLDADSHATDPELRRIREERGYSYEDIIAVSPATLPNYEEKIKSFYEEHIHEDEEIRYCLEGSGYFDVRDLSDRWIRLAVRKGDMIVLPEGIYHRFTLDSSNYIKAMRLFVGEPVWTPHNRPQEDNASRQKYVQQFGGEESKCEVL